MIRCMPTVGCLFSGMGGLAQGLGDAGFEIGWASDVDKNASATFRHRFPDVEFYERDVRSLSVSEDELAPVDILAGGFPCQSFSQAGDRRGFEDERGKLFYEIPRLICEWDPAQRPKMLLLENVPYLLYGANGAWFQQVRRELRRAGYWFREESCWIANLREETGLPQNRDRLFLVAASREHFDYNPFSPPSSEGGVVEALTIHDVVDRSEPAAEADYLPLGNRYREMIESAISLGESDQNLYQLRRNYVREKRAGLCPTLTANMGEGGHNVPFVKDDWGIRRLRVNEVARLQGFSKPATLFPESIPTNERYRLLGNAACPSLARLAGERCIGALKDCGHV